MTRLALLALALACTVQGAPGPADPPTPSAGPSAAPASPASPQETPMVPLRLEVRTAGDAAALASAASPLIHGDAPSTDAVEIVLPGGVLDGAILKLGSALDPRRLRIVVRGQGTVVRNGALHLAGVDVVVEDLVLDGGPASGEALRLQAERDVRLAGVTFVGHRAAERAPGPRTRTGLRVEALGPAATATLDRVTGVGNATPIRFTGQPGGRFREVALRGCRFADSTSPVLALGPVDALRVEETVRLGGEGAFAAAESPRTLVLTEPEERPADPALAAAWRAEATATVAAPQ